MSNDNSSRIDCTTCRNASKTNAVYSISSESLTINELSCDILLDESMTSYTEMYNWILRNQKTNLESPSKMLNNGKPPTYADITLSILSSHNNTTKQVRYVDAMPTSLGDIQFLSTASGSEFIVFNASFRFSYFEIK